MPFILALIVLAAGDWAQLNQSAIAVLGAGKFAEAERYAREAVKVSANDWQRAASYLNLGRVYRDWAKCERAVDAVERGVALFHKSGDRRVTMEAASQLVSVFLECNAADRARAIEKRWIDLAYARANLPPERLAQVLGNSAVIALIAKKYRDSEALLKEALTLARPVDQAVIWGTLALVHHETKRYPDALVAAEQALAVTEKEMGATHPLAIRTIANLSVLHSRLGNTAQADEFHARAVTLLERYYDPESPLMAEVLENRALALKDRQEKREARELAERARAIRAKAPANALQHGVSALEMRY